MHAALLFCLAALAPSATAWTPATASVPATRAAVSTRSVLTMQTATPDAPTKEPSTLPDSWVVPDTFTFPKTQAQEQPMFKVTLFKSGNLDVTFVTKAIMSVVGYDEERSAEIAEKAQLTGCATAAGTSNTGALARSSTRGNPPG